MTLPTLPEQVAAATRHGPGAVSDAIAAAGGTPFHTAGSVTLMHVGVADSIAVRHWLDLFPPLPGFTEVAPDIWATSFPLDADARIEYKLDVVRHDRHRLRVDGLNPIRAANPWGPNSELRGAAYQPPKWAAFDPTVDHGVVKRVEFISRVFGDERALHIYHPPAGSTGALLLVHDGGDYLQFAGLGKVLDNLIAAGDIPPVAAVMIDPGDRLGEYRADPSHAAHVVRDVIPLAMAETGASSVFAMGASLGGVASLHAAWAYPDVFAGLILQAGSFVTELGPHGRGAVFTPVTRFMKSFLATTRQVHGKVHVSCGRFDGLIAEAAMMSEVLAGRGADVGYADVAAGHDWHAWRDLLRPALMHVLGTGDPT